MTVSIGRHPTFGELLRSHRTAAGLTQEELAERARVSARAVSDLERGVKRRPHQATVRQLADGLGLSDEDRVRLHLAARGRWPLEPGSGEPVPGEGLPDDGERARDGSVQSNLPDEATPFIGRDRELAAILTLLRRPHVRLLTLIGPGGAGKTRLAIRAATVLDQFRDGVVFASLASLRDSSLLAASIAAALQVEPEGNRPILATVERFLRAKEVLLILDNLEHLPDAPSLVAELLDACRGLHILATSRVPLYLIREYRYTVPPLSLPAAVDRPAIDALMESEAVALFVDRAQAIHMDFALTEDNGRTVAEICLRLDGLPLAIELAVARLGVFSLHALSVRLAHRLQLLTGGPRDLPARQQTLRATIDWSYTLLDESERRLFARLSVFAGGCILESAVAISDACGDLGLNVLEGMASLVDRGLVQRRGDELRYDMLETIREYAVERLEESGQAERVRRAHAAHLLDLARAALPDETTGTIPYAALDRLESEHDNLRVALAWAEEHDPGALGLPLAVSAASFWEIRDYYWESRQWIERMLARSATASAALHARALYYLGSSSVYLGDYEAGLRRLEESLALYRTLDDRSNMILVLSVLGGCLATNLGRPAAAIPHLREAVNLARVSGPPYRLARALRELGLAVHLAGESKQAIALLEEALEALGESGDGGRIGPVYQLLGAVALGMGDRRCAEAWFCEGLARSAKAGDRAYMAFDLEGLAQIAAEDERWVRAARVWGAAESLRRAIRMPIAPVDVSRYQRWLLPIAEHLGEAAWDRLLQEGREMALDHAIAYALDAPAARGAPSTADRP